MCKGKRWGSLANDVTGIGTSTNVIKGKTYYYNMTYPNLRMSKHMGIS